MIETPSSPLNTLVDIGLVARLADEIGARQGHRPIIVCDNTLLGPVFQRPLFGADVSVYSLTKYVGGHSDLIAGAALGSETLMKPIKLLRGAVGTQLDPHSCWMIGRSLPRRWRCAWSGNSNAKVIAEFLRDHPRVAKVHYVPFLPADSPQRRVYDRQCTAGSTFSFDIEGGLAEACAASAACRSSSWPSASAARSRSPAIPAHHHALGVPQEVRARIGVGDTTIRLSVGIEHPDDLVADLAQALVGS